MDSAVGDRMFGQETSQNIGEETHKSLKELQQNHKERNFAEERNSGNPKYKGGGR